MQRAWILIPLAALLSLAGCTFGRQTAAPLAAPISITLASTAVSVTAGQKVTVTASVYDPTNQGATWTFSPLNFGTLTSQTSTSVVYIAPAEFSTATTVTITATSIANPNISSSVQLSATPLLVSISPPSSQTISPGGIFFFAPIVTGYRTNSNASWSLSPAGVGSISIPQNTDYATYAAPPACAPAVPPPCISAPTTVTLIATSVENPSVSASVQITVLPSGGGPNIAIVNVDGGSVSGQTHVNGAFTSIAICNPGSTSACQNIDGILVDTGSYGLRILQSEIPLLKLTKFVDSNGNTLENCTAASDGSYLWGPVSHADIYIAGEMALGIPIQVISSSNAPVPAGCSNGGTANANTPQLLGANGILGVGPEPTDCTLAGKNYCDGSVPATVPNLYYTCPASGCAVTDSPVAVPQPQQVTNPAFQVAPDNDGVILQLPPVSGAEATVTGTLTFGIGTELNNQLGSATVFTLDSNDDFTTVYNGQNLTSSFIDSGSNALYFPDTLPACTASPEFFCPLSLTSLSAINNGATQGQSTVNFGVDNADNLFSTYPGDAAVETLAGPEGTYNSCSQGNSSCTFDWGLPFFYGRTVYTAFYGASVAGAPKGPWWAY